MLVEGRPGLLRGCFGKMIYALYSIHSVGNRIKTRAPLV
jgi:hypothetical protein